MQLRVPKSPSEITPLWLANVLSGGNAGGDVEVADLRITTATKWNVADTAFLEVDYRPSECQLPRHLFVKITQEPDPLAELFPGEQAYYADARGTGLPIAPCLAALRDDDTGATCIILADLRQTHTSTDWPLPPILNRCHQAVRSFAKVHAHWSHAPDDVLKERDTVLYGHAQEMLPGFIDALGDRLPKERAELLTEACRRAPGLKAERYDSGRAVTRIHGDAHFWNVLYPVEATSGEAVLIDWEDWRVDIAAADLAQLIALHWYPDRRDRHERNLLKDYLSVFNAHSSRALTWDQFWLDYRLGHLCNAVIPIFQHAVGHAHGSWWSHLERWYLAFNDLECRELLCAQGDRLGRHRAL